MNVEEFIAQYWMLTKRTTTWLLHNPEMLPTFREAFSRDPDRYVRSLTWEEKDEQWTFQASLRPAKPPTSKAELLSAMFNEGEYTAVGAAMAEMLYQSSQKYGFMRRVLYKGTSHDVPEYTNAEYKRVNRIVRRMRYVPPEERTQRFRKILHILRQNEQRDMEIDRGMV